MSGSVILATACYDHSIRFFEAHNGRCARTINHADSQVNKLELTPDRQLLAAAGNPHVRLYGVEDSKQAPVTSFDGHTGNVTSVGFQKDGKWMYTGSEDGTIKIWDLRASGCQREYECGAPVNSVVLHPNQVELISGDQNGNLRVYDLVSNTCSAEFTPDGEVAIRSVACSPDMNLVCAANNKGACFVWSVEEIEGASHFEPLQKLQPHSRYVLSCKFSPNSKLLVTTSADGTARLWNTRDFSAYKTLSGHKRWVWDCVFSSDSAYLVSGSSDTTAKLWDLASGEAIRSYAHPKACVAVTLGD